MKLFTFALVVVILGCGCQRSENTAKAKLDARSKGYDTCVAGLDAASEAKDGFAARKACVQFWFQGQQ